MVKRNAPLRSGHVRLTTGLVAAGLAAASVSLAFASPALAKPLPKCKPGEHLVVLAPTTVAAGSVFFVGVWLEDIKQQPCNAAKTTAVSLAASGSGTLSGSTGTIMAGEGFTILALSYTKAGTITLSASVTSGDKAQSGTSGEIAVSPGAPSAAKTTISIAPTAVPADGSSTSTITVQAIDANGNNETAGGGAVTLSSTLGTLSPVSDNGNGTYTATLTSGRTAGTATISGTVGGSPIAQNASLTLVVATPLNIASPSVSGTAQDGSTLVASTGNWSGTLPMNYGYQWRDCNPGGQSCSDIPGATSSTYELSSADVGSTVRVVVTADNSGVGGNATTAASNPTGVVGDPAPPANTDAPTVAGAAQDGHSLTVSSNGTWSSPDALSYSYQWQSSADGGSTWSDIPDATSSTYTATAADVRNELRVLVSATDQEGQTGSATTETTSSIANPDPPGSVVAPAISGAPEDGQLVTASPGSWSTPDALSYSYQWQRCDHDGQNCQPISGANGLSYRALSPDVGSRLSVVVTATDQEGQTGSSSSDVTDVVAAPPVPSDVTVPSISGSAHDGQTLSANRGSWSSPDTLSYSYQWQRCDRGGANCEPIAGATTAYYRLAAVDVGQTLVAVITATDKEGQTGVASSDPSNPVGNPDVPSNTVAPAIGGSAQDGQVLKATRGSWTSPDPLTYTYQWQRCNPGGASCQPISGATELAYRQTSADVGSRLTLVVTAVDQEGQSTQAESTVGPVSSPAPPASTSAPAISGTPQDGHTIETTSGTWSSPDPLSYSYQWERCDSSGGNCTSVVGATNHYYRLTSVDVGQTLTVIVTATDQEGQARSASSAVSDPVASPDPPSSTVPPAISGVGQDGQVLKLARGSWSSPDTLSYSYQWERCDRSGANCVGITGATGMSYKLTSADIDHQVTAAVTATDQERQSTQATPATAVGPIINHPPPVNVLAPSISGTPQDGQTLIATRGTWSSLDGLTYAYQWQLCDSGGANCQPIGGATSAYYRLTSADIGDKVTVLITATDQAGQSTGVSATAVGKVLKPPAPLNNAAPTIVGSPLQGQILTRTGGSWSSADRLTYTTQWKRCDSSGSSCSSVAGATGSAYRVTSADAGHKLVVVVTATDQENQQTSVASAAFGTIA